MYLTFRDIKNLNCDQCNMFETQKDAEVGPFKLVLISTAEDECLYQSVGTMPCNGVVLYIVLSCPNPTYLENVAEVEIHENGNHVCSFYIFYGEDLIPCESDLGDFGTFVPTVNPADLCYWQGTKVIGTLQPDYVEISSGSSSTCCSVGA